jgi:hypothetical protein
MRSAAEPPTKAATRSCVPVLSIRARKPSLAPFRTGAACPAGGWKSVERLMPTTVVAPVAWSTSASNASSRALPPM